ncbi:COG2259 Predicted membrane protein [Candidatus Nanopelagicaceae bacterium]
MKKYFPWVGLLARLILGGVLLAAGLLKYQHLDKSQMAVRAYEMLPIALANFLGIILPFVEIAVGILLIIGAAIRISALVGGVLMFAFMIGISQAWARGLSIDCGCFGGGGQVEPGTANYLPELLRDGGLGLLAIYLFRYPQSKFGLDRHTSDGDQNNG